MNHKSLLSNISTAFLAQATSFVSSGLIAFLLPKVLGVDDYGYFQLFLFYVGYMGFLQLGLSDGVYLIHGGATRESLDKQLISQHFLVCLLIQIFFSICILLAGIFIGGSRGMVFFGVAFMLPFFNCKRFFGYVFQAINETKLFSNSIMITALSFMLPMLALLVLGINSFELYICFYSLAEVVGFLYCLIRARKILVSISRLSADIIKNVLYSIRVGIKLLIATLASTLIVGSTRFVIDAVWDISTFGKISLAITIVNFFLTCMAQVSMVLYPALRQTNNEERQSFLLKLRSVISLFSPAAFLLYFPVGYILLLWLPEYSETVKLAGILMPICVFDGLMQVVYLTYFKVERKEKELMWLNVSTVIVSIIGSCFFGFVINSIEATVAVPVFCVACRALVADRITLKEIGAKQDGVIYTLVAFSLVFVVSILFLPKILSFIVTLFLFVGVLCVRRKELVSILSGLRKMRK